MKSKSAVILAFNPAQKSGPATPGEQGRFAAEMALLAESYKLTKRELDELVGATAGYIDFHLRAKP
jgi:hypothetical protein